MANKRKLRRDQQRARENRKKFIIVAIATVSVVIIAFVVYSIIQTAGTESYTDGSQLVELLSNGTFTATLHHDASYNGTYSRSVQDGVTVVSFTSDGITYTGFIENNILELPHEWEDDHGHGGVLLKK